MFLKGYHAFADEAGGYIIDSDGHRRSEPPYLNWLLEDTQSTKVCYDLDAFAACLFRLIKLTREEAKALIEREKISLDGYDITYYPGRYLSIGFGKYTARPFVSFSDMSRYIEPVTHSPEGILERAILARDTAQNIHKALKQIGGGVNIEAVGSITGMIKPIMAKLTQPPTHLDVPEEVVRFALQNVKGNWVEAFKVGFVKEAYDYDITAAYGSILSKLPDIRRGKWVNSPDIPPDALLGFASGVVTRRSDVSPLLYRAPSDQLYGCVGSWEDVLNLDEIRFIQRWGADDFQVKDGWWWIPTAELKYPYAGIINWLFLKREENKGLPRDILKRMLAYLWGQTLADYGSRFGELYNPIYGALVESRSRLKVADFILSHGVEKNVCHIAVDGVLLDAPVTLQNKQGMGEWRLSYQSQALIVNSGFVFIEGKAGMQEFAHSFEWLKPQLEAAPDAACYVRQKFAVISLAQAVTQDKMNQLGCLESVSESIDIGAETKRFYLESPKNGRDQLTRLFSSLPLSVDFVRLR